MKQVCLANIISKEMLKEDIVKFGLKAPEMVENSKPGHFIEMKVSETTEPFLRRPISIHSLDKEKGILYIIIQLRGNGTKMLAQKQVGDSIDIIGPIGEGVFKFETSKNIAVIGGGIGIFPLYELAKQSKASGINVNTYLGFRNKDLVVLEKEFEEVSSNLCICTDDGSYKNEGYAITYLLEDLKNNKIDTIFACGPMVMLKKVKEIAKENNIDCQISLEEKMACGLGVCLGCAVKTQESTLENPEYVHVCKKGPVFDSEFVEI